MTAKVFVGNLVFSTTDEDLKTAFGSAAPVLSANIITRGRRSLGYGFVEFASEADAEKAVAALNKTEISGRPINVEVARPRDPAKEAEVREKKAARPARPARQPRVAKEAGAVEDGAAAAAPVSTEARAPRRRNPRRTGRKPEEGAAAAVTTEGGVEGEGKVAPARRGSASGVRRQRAPKRATETRPASDTTLFVANVPFATDDEQLKSFFADHKPKSAHVVRMRNNRSRGYGFVEFEDKAGQTAGLAVDGKDVPLPNGGSMKLSVKVAMTPPVVPTPAESSAPAPEAN